MARVSDRSFLRLVLKALFCLSIVSGSGAMAADAPVKEAALEFNFHQVIVFRASFLGTTPEVRVLRARARLNKLTPSQKVAPIEQDPFVFEGVSGIGLRVEDVVLFSVLAGDLDPDERLSLQAATNRAAAALSEALRSDSAQSAPENLLKDIALSILATVFAIALLWLVRRATDFLVSHLVKVIERGEGTAKWRLARHGVSLVHRLSQLVMVLLWFGVVDLWLTFVLDSFTRTRPLGEKLGSFIGDLLGDVGAGLLSALPGIATVLIILFMTMAVNDAISNFFAAVKKGHTRVRGLHKETLSATQRIVSILVWGFGIALAYPFIPLSSSDAFRGLSVMFGFMLTLGSAGIVNQLMSGLVLVYSRALTIGDFVDIGGTVGVVSEVGVLSTKVIDSRNEEVTIPNAVLVGNPIRNYSRSSDECGSLVSTRVTIGYDTPWRQVHAMLITAAELTSGLRRTPSPFVYQRDLADHYVEYELHAYMDQPLDRVPILSALHGNIQDQFNTYGVQIMSPHFNSQPPESVVVPTEKWYAAPAEPKP